MLSSSLLKYVRGQWPYNRPRSTAATSKKLTRGHVSMSLAFQFEPSEYMMTWEIKSCHRSEMCSIHYIICTVVYDTVLQFIEHQRHESPRRVPNFNLPTWVPNQLSCNAKKVSSVIFLLRRAEAAAAAGPRPYLALGGLTQCGIS